MGGRQRRELSLIYQGRSPFFSPQIVNNVKNSRTMQTEQITVPLREVLQKPWIKSVAGSVVAMGKGNSHKALSYLAVQYRIQEGLGDVYTGPIVKIENEIFFKGELEEGSSAFRVYRSINPYFRKTPTTAEKLEQRICKNPYCKKPFTANVNAERHTKQEYCTKQCKASSEWDRKKDSKVEENSPGLILVTKACAYSLCGHEFTFESKGRHHDLRRKFCCNQCGIYAHRRRSFIDGREIRKASVAPEFQDDRLNEIAQSMLYVQQYTQQELESVLNGLIKTANRIREALGDESSDSYLKEQVDHWRFTISSLKRECDRPKSAKGGKKGDREVKPREPNQTQCGAKLIQPLISGILTPFTPPMSANDVVTRIALTKGKGDARYRNPSHRGTKRVLNQGYANGSLKRFASPFKRGLVFCSFTFYPNPLPGDVIRELVGGVKGAEGTVVGYIRNVQLDKLCPLVRFEPSQRNPDLRSGYTRMVNPEFCFVVHRPETEKVTQQPHEQLQAG